MDPFEKQRIDAMAEVFDLNSQIIALPKEWHYLLDLTNEWLDLTLNGIKEAQAEQLKSAAIAEIQANITYLEGEQAKIEQALADAKSLYIDALNREISALQEAQDKLQAAYDTAKSLYSDALNREISALQAKQTELENNAESAKSDYIDAIKREIDAIKREIDAKKEAIGVTENLSDEWADLAKTIKETRDSLFLGAESALNPGQKTSFAGSQFQGAMQGIFAGDYEQAKNIPGYAQDYLSAARGATANRHEYANIFGQVQAQLATAASIAESKGIKATDEQIAENTAMSSMSLSELEALLATLVPAELTLAEAQQKYQEAQLALDSSNYQVEIALLEKELAALNGEVLTLSQAQLKYNEAKTALDLSTYDAQIEYYQEALDEFDEIIRLDDARNAYLRAQNDFDRASYQTDLAYWNQELNLLQAINAGIQTIATSEYNAFVGTPTGFADGGIATGPASGHWELLHGDELVVPLNNIRGSSTRSSGDDEEIKALLRELIALNRGNTEYSRKLYRVLDRVTGGENSLQTRAA